MNQISSRLEPPGRIAPDQCSGITARRRENLANRPAGAIVADGCPAASPARPRKEVIAMKIKTDVKAGLKAERVQDGNA
jgi:hypothetical protein